MKEFARSTVKNILKEHGFDTAPQRGVCTWDAFIQRHADTLWACDFFSKKVWTKAGLVDFFVLFFIQVGSRRVQVAGLTTHPDRAWMMQQARSVAACFADQEQRPTILLRDFDGKFVPEFDALLQAGGIEVLPVGPAAPNLNAYAERWVLSMKSECLDHFVVLGEDHLRHLVSEYLIHYHQERPHQGKDNLLLMDASSPSPTPFVAHDIAGEERMGGLLKHYRRYVG